MNSDLMRSVPIGTNVRVLVARLPTILKLGLGTTCYVVRYGRTPGAERRAELADDLQATVAAWLRHTEPSPQDILSISSDTLENGALARAEQWASAAQKALALASKCTLVDNRILHIPMMDFRCDPSAANVTFIAEALSYIEMSGFIVRSERSLHFYGAELVDESRWRHFLAQCLLFKDLMDCRYIAHCLMYGMCALRIPPDEPSRGPYTVVSTVRV
jgi:hypothetical protein